MSCYLYAASIAEIYVTEMLLVEEATCSVCLKNGSQHPRHERRMIVSDEPVWI
jgi:hypothetical protein